MPINLASYIQPRNGNTWFLLEDVYLRGGFQVRATIAARDGIDALNRKHGMLVYTQDVGKIWQLQADLITWIEFSGGSGGSADLREVAIHVTPVLQPAETYSFQQSLGRTAAVFNLSVDQPCEIKVFSTVGLLDPNPYTFVAIRNHLTDNGLFIDVLGDIHYDQRSFVLSNMDAVPNAVTYWQLTNLTNSAVAFTVIATFLTLEDGD